MIMNVTSANDEDDQEGNDVTAASFASADYAAVAVAVAAAAAAAADLDQEKRKEGRNKANTLQSRAVVKTIRLKY